MAHPTDEEEADAPWLNFDRTTSDADLLPFRQIDDALGLTELAGAVRSSRQQHPP